MKNETPVEGIMKKKDYGNAVWYEVDCECGDRGHSHSVWIEADADAKQVMVDISIESKTDWWSKTVDENPAIENVTLFWICSWAAYILNETVRRSRLIWNILFRGYVKYETQIILNQQQAANYADTLKRAVKEIGKK